ncbi:Holliday junction resolvase RuvX [Neptunomonas qingdaonensis]|uniref:Putative pre-16S rRNA nuclease n=1 Tax=Neptunomonas qingdaonensis TaxID=1045558 RepID=A0A1I2M0U3_9GAMM|nr:Holliday junction resolvase RuvX [Neptunomonas qingdaonensis]SFF85155.1 putative holliday junction resolvase [Neptunomonas qingdaonensis]
MTASSQQVLAFDFGTRRIGLATGQSITFTTLALPPLPAKDGTPDWGMLDKTIKEWQPDTLVVGIPLNMDGTISEMSRRARRFANRIQDRYQRPCYLMDERLSTAEAKEIHFAQGGGTNFRKESVDGIAAQIILESWFSSTQRIPSHTRLEDIYGNGNTEC